MLCACGSEVLEIVPHELVVERGAGQHAVYRLRNRLVAAALPEIVR
jgi:hypothetical protein